MPYSAFHKQRSAEAPIDLSLFAHIINDAHMAGSFQLEGNFFRRTASYLSRYIECLSEDNLPPEILSLKRSMRQLIHYETITSEIPSQVHLKQISTEITDVVLNHEAENSSLMLPGGWSDPTGGHAMLYVFKQEADGLGFYIYNAGAGLQYHDQYSAFEREVRSPVIAFTLPNPINKQKLIELVEVLILARNPQLHSQHLPYFNAQRLYQDIFSKLLSLNKNNYIKPSIVKELNTRGQLSGSCAEAVLHELLHEAFVDKATYKQFLYRFQRYAMNDFMKYADFQNPGVVNQINHAISTLESSLLTEDLFEKDFIQTEHHALKNCRKMLPQPVALVKNRQRVDTTLDVKTKLHVNLSEPIEDSSFTQRIECRHQKSPLGVLIGGADLLQHLTAISNQCQQLLAYSQYEDVIDGLERVFLAFPLPSTKQAFDAPIEFYQAINVENLADFYRVVEALLECYMRACKFRSIDGVARNMVVGFSVMSTLDYIQNRLLPSHAWDNTSAMHAIVTRCVNQFFKGNSNNPWLATNNPLLDQRLQRIKSIYIRQQALTQERVTHKILKAAIVAVTLPAELIYTMVTMPFFNRSFGAISRLLSNQFCDYNIAFYTQIIDSEPALKKELEEQYEMTNTPEGKSIDGFLRSYGCHALYVLSTQRYKLESQAHFIPLIQKLKNQECLERLLFNDIVLSIFSKHIEGYDEIDLIIYGSTSFIDTAKYSMPTRASLASAVSSKITDTLKNRNVPTKRALVNDHNAIHRLSDNELQLLPSSKMGKHLLANRQYSYLRHAPSLQVKETLHYYSSHFDKLSDVVEQKYLEANIFQPGLLLIEVKQHERSNILALVEDFCEAGLQHNTIQGKCTQDALFFVRFAFLVYDYAAKAKAPLAVNMLEKLQQRLISLLDVNKDNTIAIKHTLYSYQFLTAMSCMRLSMERGDRQSETQMSLLISSLFYINTYNNPIIKSKPATQFDLMCAKSAFRYHFQQLTREFIISNIKKEIGAFGDFEFTESSENNKNFLQFTSVHNDITSVIFVDASRGLIFNRDGFSKTLTPSYLTALISIHFPSEVVPPSSFVNKQSNCYLIGFPDTIFRYRNNHLEKKWVVNGISAWYALFEGVPSINDQLPVTLRERGKQLWLKAEKDKTFLIAENERPIYRYDTCQQHLCELDIDGNDKGYILCSDVTWLHDMFSVFEDPSFMLVSVKYNSNAMFSMFSMFLQHVSDRRNEEYKVELSRYGIALLVSHENDEWCFRLQQEPSFRLLIDQTSNVPLKPPGFSGVAALIFKDDKTEQCFCYIPVQAFLALNEQSEHSEFYQFEQDKSGRINKAMLEQENENIVLVAKYTETERFVSFLLDENLRPKPRSTHEALFLCYLYLGSHRPEQAWSTLAYAEKRLPGLLGTVDEISYLHMIVNQLPLALSSLDEKATVKTPPYVATQLKALAMLTRVLGPDVRIDFKNNNCFTHGSPEAVCQIKRLAETQAFYNGLNEIVYTLYSRYQTMGHDVTHKFLLPDEQRQCLLDYYYLNLPDAGPKAMGALGFEQQSLYLKKIIKERVALEAEKQSKGRLPVAYDDRLQEITAVLQQTQLVRGHHVHLQLIRCQLSIPPEWRALVLPKNFVLEYDINKVPTTDDLNHATNALIEPINPDEFSHSLPVFFRVLLTSSDLELRSKLITFCYRHLRTHRHTEPSKQPLLVYLCNIIFRIEKSMGFFLKNLSFIAPVIDVTSAMLPACNILFTTLFDMAESLPDPTLSVYEAHDALSIHLPLNSEAWANQTPIPSQPMVSNKTQKLSCFTFEKLLDACRLSRDQKLNIRVLAIQYRRRAALFSAPPDREILDFHSERQAGKIQGDALHQMKEFAVQLLSKQEVREELGQQAKAYIAALDNEITVTISQAIDEANRGFEESEEQALRKSLELDSGQRAPLDEEKLLSLYLQADKALYALETGLEEHKINQLHHLIGDFLALSARQQALQRFVNKVDKPDNDLSDSAMALAAHELFTEDLVDYTIDTVQALFQYHEKILLRQQQQAAIGRLIDTTDGFTYQPIVEKIIMGGGKSKVILPLVAKYKANGTNLVVVELTGGIFETGASDLTNTSGRLFNQKVFRFCFNRETSCSARYLAFLHTKLHDVMVRRDYVVTTGEAVCSLELKFIEILLNKPDSKEKQKSWEEQVAGLQKLVHLFRTRSHAVIDEVHQALLLKKKLNYPVGDEQTTSQEVIQNTIALYVFFDNVVLGNILPGKTLADLVFNHKLLTNEEAWSKVFSRLSLELIKHPQSPLKNNLQHLNEEEKKQLYAYFLDKTQESCDTPDCVTHADPKLRKLLARYKEFVSRVLPLVLRRSLNEDYGLPHVHSDLSLAIPYKGNNQPSENSRFGNDREAMCFTIQTMLKGGLTRHILCQYIKNLQEQASCELLKNPYILYVNNTPAGQSFQQLVPGYQLGQIDIKNTEQFNRLFDELSYNRSLIFEVLEKEILPQLTFDTKVLSSNANTHLNVYASVQGITGTPDYHGFLNYDKQKIPATDGFIINLLERKQTQIRTADYSQPSEQLLRTLIADQPDIRAIIDISAVFKQTNYSVSTHIAQYLREVDSPIQYVMFFNEDNMLCALSVKLDKKPIVLNFSDPGIINAVLGCAPEERFTYYDQVHTLGVDIKQAASAKALALIDHETMLQKGLQGFTRMRELASEQTLDIIVPKALAGYSFDAIMNLMENNQQNHSKKNSFTGFKSQMSARVRNHMMLHVMEHHSAEDMHQVVVKYEDCFVDNIASEPDFHVSTVRDTAILLEEHKNKLIAIDPDKLAVLGPVLDDIIRLALSVCEKQYLSTSGQEEGIEVELEHQVELENEQEQELELELEKRTLKPFPYMPWFFLPKYQYYSRAAGFMSLTSLCCDSNDAPQFGEIYASSNYYQVYVGQTQMISKYLKPVHALLFRQHSDTTFDCAILSQKEAEELALKMKQSPQSNIWICNTAMTTLAGEAPEGIQEHAGYQELIEQARFFSGELKLLLKGDVPLNWLRKDTEKKMRFFRESLCRYRETDSYDIIALNQTLSLHKLAFNCIAQNPTIDYTAINWREQISELLSDNQSVQIRFADILKRHHLGTITEAMSEHSDDIFSTFLRHNHFKTNAEQLKEILSTVDTTTSNHIATILLSLEGVSSEVYHQIWKKQQRDAYNYYLNYITDLFALLRTALLGLVNVSLGAIVIGSGVMASYVSALGLALLSIGIFTLNPPVFGIGCAMFALGMIALYAMELLVTSYVDESSKTYPGEIDEDLVVNEPDVDATYSATTNQDSVSNAGYFCEDDYQLSAGMMI